MKKHLEPEDMESIVRTPFDGRRFKNAADEESSLRILSQNF